MYDDYYSRLIATEKFFYPRDGNEIIKIHESGVRQGLKLRDKQTANCEFSLTRVVP